MLVDVGTFSVDPLILMLSGARPRRVGKGLYLGCGFNFHNLLPRGKWDDMWADDDAPVPEYGVVDSVEQFVERFGGALEKDPGEYAVGFTEVRRDDQEPEGGWRWHKWGSYHGKHEPQHEYLYDEDGIDRVFTFRVMRRKA